MILELVKRGIKINGGLINRTLSMAENLFPNGIDPRLNKWNLNRSPQGLTNTTCCVYQMKENATFIEIFNELKNIHPNLLLTQEQIVSFCENYQNDFRQNGYATFFFFREHDTVYVADAYIDEEGIDMFINKLTRAGVWYGGFAHRVVVAE